MNGFNGNVNHKKIFANRLEMVANSMSPYHRNCS